MRLAVAGWLLVLAGTVQGATLDPAGVQGVRHMMRAEAAAAVTAPARSIWDWSSVGLVTPAESAVTRGVRFDFDRDAEAAARHYARPVLFDSPIHAVNPGEAGRTVIGIIDGGPTGGPRRMDPISPPRPGDIQGQQLIRSYRTTATLVPGHAARFATWRFGQRVTLRCADIVKTGDRIMLRDCEPQEVVLERARAIADRMTDHLLAGEAMELRPAGGTPPEEAARTMLFAGYTLGLAGRACPADDLAAWATCAQQALRAMQPEPMAALDAQAARDLAR